MIAFVLAVIAFLETLASRLRRGPLRPGWSFLLECAVRFLRRGTARVEAWPPQRLRAAMEARRPPQPMARRCERRAELVGGVDGEWFIPPGAPADAALIYVHGGSFVAGSSRTYADAIARLALAAGLATFAPNYRLAPEHPYPAGALDVLAVFRALVEGGTAAARIGLAGESAGGNLALKVLLLLRDAGEASPAATVITSGWFDMTGSLPSVQANERFDYGSRVLLRAQAGQASGGAALDDPAISLVHADLRGIAPILIQAGTAEMLLDESQLVYRHAVEAGVDARFEALVEMPHAATLLAEFAPEGARAVESGARFIRDRVTPPTPARSV
ncbi:MAG TPA: alpha/beta hydrolase fold domain-containing protein [Polyangiaceae bacterium]|nr:alpha/beta hydrolase fold domain-containing protein [Polyangiaceae bacterium]